MTYDLTVVIPCYNEAGRIAPFFQLIREHLDLPWEWLFVSDGSTDATGEMVNAFRAEVGDRVRLGGYADNRGKGAAVRSGLLEARGHLVGYVDVDLAASPLEFRQWVDRVDPRANAAAGKSIVAGIRVKTHHGNVHRTFYRHIMGRVFQTYVSNMTGLTMYDTQCGFKLMSGAAARDIAGRMACNGFAFDVELLMIADRLGYRIHEVLIDWREMGQTKVRPKHILYMIREIFQIRRRVNGLALTTGD